MAAGLARFELFDDDEDEFANSVEVAVVSLKEPVLDTEGVADDDRDELDFDVRSWTVVSAVA